MKKSAVPNGFPMNLRLTRRLSAITSRSGHPGRVMPPLTRGNFDQGKRWTPDVPRETLTRQALAQGTLEKFIAAKQAPRTLSTDFPPQLQTNENAMFPGQVQGDIPSSEMDTRGTGFASKAATAEALRLLKAALRA